MGHIKEIKRIILRYFLEEMELNKPILYLPISMNCWTSGLKIETVLSLLPLIGLYFRTHIMVHIRVM